MFEKGKKFIKEHKVEIIAGGFILAAGVIIGAKLNGKMNAKVIAVGNSLRGKEWISWKPTNDSIELETVQKFLELNADNHAKYAIFRRGTDPSKYLCLFMDDLLIEPEMINK